jgi:hypothetical protein
MILHIRQMLYNVKFTLVTTSPFPTCLQESEIERYSGNFYILILKTCLIYWHYHYLCH